MEARHTDNGLIPMGSSGDGFLSGIPWWVYLIVILVGIGLSVFLFLQAASAKRRAMAPPLPGSPPPLPGSAPAGTGSGLMLGAIVSALLLVVAPLVAMLIMQPWHSNWLVGRWGETAACTGQTVEFTRDGFAISMGDRRPYRLEGNQITVNGRTETLQHDGDRFTVDGQTFTRCAN